jgi:hypothetical protein
MSRRRSAVPLLHSPPSKGASVFEVSIASLLGIGTITVGLHYQPDPSISFALSVRVGFISFLIPLQQRTLFTVFHKASKVDVCDNAERRLLSRLGSPRHSSI